MQFGTDDPRHQWFNTTLGVWCGVFDESTGQSRNGVFVAVNEYSAGYINSSEGSTQMTVANSELTGYVTNLVEGFSLPDAGERRLARALYDRLANGRPVSPQALAQALDLPVEAVRDALDQLPRSFVEFDADGNVTEFVGLGLETTPHEFVVRGNTLHTWCALDSLFIPAILGETVQVLSTAPITGDTIRITVRPDGIEGVDPADAVMTFATPAFEVMHASASVEDVQFAFCDWVCFFPSPAAANEWLKDNRGPAVVSVAEAYELARHMNKIRFPDLVT